MKDFKVPSSFVSSPSSKYKEPLRHVPKFGEERIKADTPAHDPSAYARASERQQPSDTQQTAQTPPRPAQETPVEPPPSEPLPDLRDGIPSDYKPDEPKDPLPDLTRGIPSTLDAELEQASRKGRASPESLNITEEAVDPQSPEHADRGGDGLPRSSYVSSSDRRRSALMKYFYVSAALGTILYGVYIGRDFDEEEAAFHKDVSNGYTPGLMYRRAMARWGSTMSYYKDPVTKKLLPDAHLMDPNMPPYTLVIGLEDVLVHSEWSRQHGWRIAKRPGLDYFLKYLSPYYELVVFSAQPSMTVDQIHRKIDPYQMVYPLFREMTVYEDGGYVKDLSYLNRDLKKVVMVDADPHAVKNQPDNAIILPKWNGDPKDTTLIDLIPFLENLANLNYADTREVIKSFEGKDIAKEFDRRQKLMRERWQAERAEKKAKRGGFSLGSIFGSKPKSVDGMQSYSDAEAEGKMYSDIIRDRGHDMYQRLNKHLETEGPKIIAEREAMEKKMQEEAMASMKSGMFGFFGPGASKEQGK